ncbi:MAG: nucleotidyltransferase domain-containing protein [Bacteroidales bacterium]|nr:nucleotidyltransferase domain-containing protein [Bacteroidales bacterium]
MTENTNKQLKKIVELLVGKFDISKIFLFGSFAYGSPTVESDLDICLIAEFEGKRKIDLLRKIRRELSDKFKGSVDLLIYKEKEFNERASFNSTLEHKIFTDGILLNG